MRIGMIMHRNIIETRAGNAKKHYLPSCFFLKERRNVEISTKIKVGKVFAIDKGKTAKPIGNRKEKKNESRNY